MFIVLSRTIASSLELPLVDCFSDYETLRRDDQDAWSLIMSDEIHPNMDGHIRFVISYTDGVPVVRFVPTESGN